jgi:hypothetical protein
MSFLDRLASSIEERLAALDQEIATLESVRTALSGGTGAAPGRRARALRARGRPQAAPAATSPPPTARADGSGDAGGRPRPMTGPELAESIEQMLRESPGGLSAVTIAKRAGASYGQVLAMLRALEQNGQLRRTGERRTSLWRLISEEELIAERAAELERLARHGAG